MYFYISFLLLYTAMSVFSKNIVTKSGLNQPTPFSIGLKFFAEINNTSGEDCTVEVHPDECCLDANDEKCNIIEVIGGATAIIPEGTSKTLELVAPLLDPYDRRGFCTIYLDLKSKSRPRNFIRDTIKIKFDTTLHKSRLPDEAKLCKHIDEDPLNECRPVNCMTYYNGRKSFYNILQKRCTEVPPCFANTNDDIPKTAYNPISNKCMNTPAISKDDIKFIKALTEGKDRTSKEVMIINMQTDVNASLTTEESEFITYQTIVRITGFTATPSHPKTTKKCQNTTTHSHKTTKTTQKTTTKKCHKTTKVPDNSVKDDRKNCIMIHLSLTKYSLVILSVVILLQCGLICTMLYCMSNKCCCCKKKEVVKKFFNYRQDVSVTTPLICTSNINTETTDYQYQSESSNYIDKKIKCYKACQRERKNNVKLSMSDDILSKCLTRRDWKRLPRSETIPEGRNDEVVSKASDKKETKVNFQEEYHNKKSKPIKSIVKKTENKISGEQLSDSSEKLIKCHSYNNNYDSEVADFKQSTHSNTLGLYKQEKKAESIEQGAQAYFSNDSIDDFLSERGVLFIGDNASKYSFTSISSAAKSSISSQSSKTSKHNVVKNVMTLLSRKVIRGPSSDPGLQKSKADLDLELLHISQASMCSSSNDTDFCKDLKKIRESTSSL